MKKKNNLKLFIIGLSLSSFISCSSLKKNQQDDDFATDDNLPSTSSNTSGSSNDISNEDLVLDNQNNSSIQAAQDGNETKEVDEFSDFGESKNNSTQVSSEANGNPVQNKDEFSDFDQNSQNQSTNISESATGADAQVAAQPQETTAQQPITSDSSNINSITAQNSEPLTNSNLDLLPSSDANLNSNEHIGASQSQDTIAQIKSVQYKSNQNGGALSILADTPLKYTTRMNSATNQLVIEVQNAHISAQLKRSLNTKDMASSIGSIDIYQKSNSKIARFVVQLRPGSVEPLVQPEGPSLLVIGAPNEAYLASQKRIQEQASESHGEQSSSDDSSKDGLMTTASLEDFLIGNHKFYGKKISIETNNLDVKEAIKFIAEESGANLLMDDGLEGKISLKLKQVPWDQALILILKAKKLGYVRQGNVLRIAKLSDLQAEEVSAYKMLETRRNNEPLIVKRFFINYAKLSEIEIKIKDFIFSTSPTSTANPIGQSSNTNSNGGSNSSSNSNNSNSNNQNSQGNQNNAAAQGASSIQRGRVISDERTGSIIVTDTAENIAKIEKLINALDTQPKQIVVENRIINASESFERSLGISWSSTGSSKTPNSARLGVKNDVANGVFDSTFVWGNIDVVGDLGARIALGEIQNKVHVLNTQRTTIISGQVAKIDAKSTLRIEKISTNTASNTTIGTTDFTTIDYGLTGEILPQASNENTISADIKLNQVKIDDRKTGSTSSQGIGGKVIAKNGQTIVVQANFESSNTTNESGVPGLKDIPVLGMLFKGKNDASKKSETMLFVTLNILDSISGALKKASIGDPSDEASKH